MSSICMPRSMGWMAVALLAGSIGVARAETSNPPSPADTLAQSMGHASHAFRKAEAPVSGSFTISNQGGKQTLVLSKDFKTNDMAPDLKVVFSPSTNPLATTKAPGYPLKPGTYTILAPLKSSAGPQSYPIPASIDLSRQGSVLIWCQKFNATMAWAPLKP